jgi:hypothetical protein
LGFRASARLARFLLIILIKGQAEALNAPRSRIDKRRNA